MKKLLAACFIVASFLSSGQRKVEVSIIEKEMSQGKQTVFVVLIPEAKMDFVETRWKRYANDRSVIENIAKGAPGRFVENTYKTIVNTVSPEKELEKNKQKLKVVNENDEYIVRNIVHKHITQRLLDIYARISQIDSSTQVSAYFRFTDSIFIDPANVDEETIIALKNYMYDFGVETYRGEVENQIDMEKKGLRKLNVVLDNLLSKNESLEKSIARAETEIGNCESEINLNNEQLTRAIRMVGDVKKQMLGKTKGTPEYEELKLSLKEREKEKKKIVSDTKQLKSKIKQQEFKIKKAINEISANERDQLMQLSKIEQQEKVIQDIENKLSNIR